MPKNLKNEYQFPPASVERLRSQIKKDPYPILMRVMGTALAKKMDRELLALFSEPGSSRLKKGE